MWLVQVDPFSSRFQSLRTLPPIISGADLSESAAIVIHSANVVH